MTFVFANAQTDDEMSGDGELVFREYCEALVAVSFFKFPNVMLPPSSRLNNFLHTQFFPVIWTFKPKLKVVNEKYGTK